MQIEVWDRLPPTLTWEEKIALLAHQFMKLEQTVTPLEHRFEPGWYIRTMKIPKETFFVGRKHLLGHDIRLLQGDVIYVTDKGKTRVQAPFSLHSAPGFYAIAYTITDVLAETWHENTQENRDTDALELRAFEPASALLDRGRLIQERLLT